MEFEHPGGSSGEVSVAPSGGDEGGSCWERRGAGATVVLSRFYFDLVVEMTKTMTFIKEIILVCSPFLRVEANRGQDLQVCSPLLLSLFGNSLITFSTGL